jgi:hypothetical protein
MREMVGAWEMQIQKYSEGKPETEKYFLWVSHDWTRHHTDKTDKKSRGITNWKNYSETMIDKAYLAARQLGIASRPLEREVGGVLIRGFIVAPHDALCARRGCYCEFVGPRNVKGTAWSSEMGFDESGKPTGKVSVIFNGFLLEGTDAGTLAGTDKGTLEGTLVGTDKGTLEGTENNVLQGEACRDGRSIDEVFENPEDSQELVGIKPAVSASDSRTYPGFRAFPLVSQFLEGQPVLADPKAASHLSSGLLTDQKQMPGHPLREGLTASTTDDNEPSATEVKNDATESTATADKLSACAPLSSAPDLPARPSVGQYFAGAGDNILDSLCDGEFNAAIEKVWKRWGDLDDACREVVRTYGSMILVDRKTLSYLVGKVMDVLVREHSGRVNKYMTSTFAWPPGLLKAKEALEHGGALLRDRPPDFVTVFEEMTAEKLAAWNEFSDSDEGQKYPDVEQRFEVFQKIYANGESK